MVKRNLQGQILDVQDVAAILHCHCQNVRRMISRGDLRATQLSRDSWAIRGEALQEYLQGKSRRTR